MKANINKKFIAVLKTVLICVACVMLIIYAFLNFSAVSRKFFEFVGVFFPIFYGALIAYMLCPGVKFFERRVLRKWYQKGKYKLVRVVSVVMIFLIVILSIAFYCWKVLPRVLAGYAELQSLSEMYIGTLKEWILNIPVGTNFLSRYLTKLLEYFVGLLETFYSSFGSLIPDAMTIAKMLVGVFSDLLLGVVLSVYFLLAREKLLAQGKKVLRAFLNTGKYRMFSKSVRLADHNFGGYIKGQVADAIVMGTVSYVCLLLIGLPYYPLVSTLIGISNLIPVFGPWIGTIVGVGIIFLANPQASFWFLGLMIILHQMNKHMIRPYVLRVGVDASTMFMFAAIIIMTGLIGFWGLMIGVPVFAILYAILHIAVDGRLKQKGLPVDPEDYYATEAGKELYREREYKRARRRRGTKEDETEKEDFVLKKEETAVPKEVSEKKEESEKEEISV
jgi:predicted PurR-regulated permease PerM